MPEIFTLDLIYTPAEKISYFIRYHSMLLVWIAIAVVIAIVMIVILIKKSHKKGR